MLGPRIDVPVIRGRAPHDGRRRLHLESLSETRLLAPPGRHRFSVATVLTRVVATCDRCIVMVVSARGWGSTCCGTHAWSKRSGILPVSCRRWGRVRRWTGGGSILPIVRCSTTRGDLSASAIGIQRIAIVVVALKIVDIPRPGIVIAVRTHDVAIAAIGARSAGPSSPGTVGNGPNLRRVAALIAPGQAMTQ